MKTEDYIDLLKQALLSPCGIIIRYRNGFLSRYVRQNLYRTRSGLRLKLDNQFNGLSFIVTKEGNLKIIKRKVLALNKSDELEKPHTEYLSWNELPDFIASRGKSA